MDLAQYSVSQQMDLPLAAEYILSLYYRGSSKQNHYVEVYLGGTLLETLFAKDAKKANKAEYIVNLNPGIINLDLVNTGSTNVLGMLFDDICLEPTSEGNCTGVAPPIVIPP